MLNKIMRWNRKYNYKTSTRAIFNGKRHYDVNNEKLPSVTSILNSTMPLSKKESLNRWRESVGQKQAEIITREAANRGSSLHKHLEDYINNKLNLDLLGDNTKEKMMADIIVENGLKNKLNEIWGCEETLFFPNKYAGAADLIAGNYEGSPAILDFKSSTRARQDSWNDEYYLQTAGYIAAHNAVYRTSINKGVILVCTKDLFFQRFIIEGERLKKYEDEFFQRVEQYYSQQNI